MDTRNKWINVNGVLKKNPNYLNNSSNPTPATTLNSYTNLKADYDSATGLVSCSYRSSKANEGEFSVDYLLTNAKGGVVRWQQANAIGISFPLGLKR